MSHSILILGEAATGKSTAIRTLPPEETLVVSVIGKSLPFRGAKSKYTRLSSDGTTGNYYTSDDSGAILRVIKLVNDKRLDIKYLVLDDFGYTMTNSFMKRALEVGYRKFSEIGLDAFKIFDIVSSLRDDLFCFVIMHTEIDGNGRYKPRTIGKMVDQYVCIEGKFLYVFHALASEGKYRLLTNNDGTHMSRSPMGMFDELYIDNDLKLICDTITNYEDE